MLTLRRRAGCSNVQISFSERADGDCAPLEASSDASMTVLKQVHGNRVVRVVEPGDHCGVRADAAWTATAGATLAVRTADCVPVALYGCDPSGHGAVAAVHAGWRGALAGVVEATATELAAHGFGQLRAVIGPHICPLHYEFGAADLHRAEAWGGPSVVGTTAWGTHALDLGAAMQLALRRGGVALDIDLRRCTASDFRYFSHRARAEDGRTALLICLETTQHHGDVDV